MKPRKRKNEKGEPLLVMYNATGNTVKIYSVFSANERFIIFFSFLTFTIEHFFSRISTSTIEWDQTTTESNLNSKCLATNNGGKQKQKRFYFSITKQESNNVSKDHNGDRTSGSCWEVHFRWQELESLKERNNILGRKNFMDARSSCTWSLYSSKEVIIYLL